MNPVHLHTSSGPAFVPNCNQRGFRLLLLPCCCCPAAAAPAAVRFSCCLWCCSCYSICCPWCCPCWLHLQLVISLKTASFPYELNFSDSPVIRLISKSFGSCVWQVETIHAWCRIRMPRLTQSITGRLTFGTEMMEPSTAVQRHDRSTRSTRSTLAHRARWRTGQRILKPLKGILFKANRPRECVKPVDWVGLLTVAVAMDTTLAGFFHASHQPPRCCGCCWCCRWLLRLLRLMAADVVIVSAPAVAASINLVNSQLSFCFCFCSWCWETKLKNLFSSNWTLQWLHGDAFWLHATLLYGFVVWRLPSFLSTLFPTFRCIKFDLWAPFHVCLTFFVGHPGEVGQRFRTGD